jgi:hypothetical protein
MLSIYSDESASTEATPDQVAEVMSAYEAFGREAGDKVIAGDGLQPTSTATTVRVTDGEQVLTDGPFAETKEQLAGFYLIDCKDLDEALGWAAKVPAAYMGGCVEVRPVMDY